ncbi:MAG: S41 family peptidase [Roseiflexaceae bacterium]
MILRRPIPALFAALLALALCACTPGMPDLPLIAQAPTTTPTLAPRPTPQPSATPMPSATPQPSATPTATITPTPSPTFEPLPPTATFAPLARSEREAIFDRVWTLVRDRYVYTDYRGLDWNAVRDEYAPRVAAAETPEAFYAILREMIDQLGDDHSRYESPREVAEQQAEFEGDLRYAGIGAIVRELPEGGLITRVARGGPAEDAGLRPHDLILVVGGISFTDTARFGPDGPIGVVRGPPGSVVRLTVRSPGEAPREIDLTRRAIDADAFAQIEAQRLPGGRIGLIRIDTFYIEAIDERVRAELVRLLEAGPLDGLIIDVRGNGGGRLDLMLATIGLFVDGGTIGSSVGRRVENRLRVPSGEVLPGLAKTPIVVLVGSETASAAEMFAAGMRVLDRARVVGVPSSGNTENLVPHDLSDGSRLWLAELNYRLPDGSQLEGRGVQPDRVVDVEWWRFDPADDPQVRAAIEELGVK